MKTRLLLVTFLLSPAAIAKSATKDVRYTRGLMSNIVCRYASKAELPPAVGSYDFDSIDKKNVVCDPLSETKSSAPDMGLIGRLILRTPAMESKAGSAMTYINEGDWLDQKIYFSSVNVPTRDFTKGFTTQNGDVLKDENGNKLTQYFGIEYTSNLQLSASDKAGDYEIALLSDDGSRLFVQESGTWNEIVNNDGDHSTRLGCPYRTIHMDKNVQVPIKIAYYQGPGNSLANVMLWRRLPKAKTWKNPANHSLCGFKGDRYFYSPSGSKTLAMRYLQFQGWNVVSPENFKMPASTPNPCVTLVISDFVKVSSDASSAVLSWTTNLPATSQLRIINAFTGEEITTAYNAELSTSHQVTISGLQYGVVYKVQAISSDGQGHTVTSDPVVVVPN